MCRLLVRDELDGNLVETSAAKKRARAASQQRFFFLLQKHTSPSAAIRVRNIENTNQNKDGIKQVKFPPPI
jgi:hypothetical protein